MLSPKAQLNLQHAKEYFREHLSVGDYYAQGQQVAGEWFGEGAEKLGLKGVVREADFLALCEGVNPATGEKLTARRNSQRRENGQTVANRRVFYDFTISPPKSVSVVALMQDDRILELHNRAVKMAMTELEKFAAARVRKSGQHGDRTTGNVIAAAFRHDTSRELDPHLHTHCVVLNATFDQVENRWKALEVQGMYRAQKFAENLYYHELAKGLRSFGYALESNSRDFEIKGVPRSVITRFSKRHQQIDEETQRRLEQGGQPADVNTVRRRVARDDRKRKIKESTAGRLRPAWAKQLTAEEAKALAKLKSTPTPGNARADVAAAVAWADEHLFSRRSVVNDFELWSEALAQGRGQGFGLADLRQAIEARDYVREDGTRRLTSREVLRCELEIVLAARDGRQRHAALNPDYAPSAALSAEQGAAVRHILTRPDFIMLFAGGAGTGKSRTLREVDRGLAAAGRPVVVLAPQKGQVLDLQKDGLPAQTLAQMLLTKTLPRGAVVLLDEAGQVGGRDLRALIGLVRANGGRLILSGDTRQHGAVAASDALRAIERYAGLKPAVIRAIRRQDPKLGMTPKERDFIRAYRAAVKAAAKGDIIDSFDRLDRLGCFRECSTDEQRDALAAEYLAAVGRKDSALVVGQTREEVRQVNETVRGHLLAAGKIGAGVVLPTCRPLDLDDAQKRDARSYEPGQRAFFLQRYGRFAKGELCEIAGANERGVVLVKDGRRSTLNYRYASRIVVATVSDLELAPGDRLQLKFNGKSAEGASFANGELVTVRRVQRDGSLAVTGDDGTRKTLTPSQRLFVRGHAVTSYSSQGKTVNTVIFSDAANRAATNAQQWYVTISRGQKRVVLFTSDKAALRASVQRAGDRDLALELKTRANALGATPRQRPAWLRQAWANIQRVKRHRFLQSLRSQPKRAQRVRP